MVTHNTVRDHTSERRALVDWITLFIADTDTEGTDPTPNLETFLRRILMGANVSRGITPYRVRVVLRGHTHTPLSFQLANWEELKFLHAIKDVSDPGGVSLHCPPSMFLVLPHLLPPHRT